ncbi:MAG: hypothetical protein AAFX76_01700 [Planctomycetota bacterium]
MPQRPTPPHPETPARPRGTAPVAALVTSAFIAFVAAATFHDARLAPAGPDASPPAHPRAVVENPAPGSLNPDPPPATPAFLPV